MALILLIFMSGIGDVFKSPDNTVTAEEQLEQRLAKMLSGMDGIGEENISDVMIRLDDDGRTVTGAVIVCTKADDPIVKERLLDAVSKALDVSVSRVCITK
ncbi:MAG: hypothetical protein J1E39_00345 [Eubacterium sp.]|nr:hypothetical protein [Eubacterium sp.]